MSGREQYEAAPAGQQPNYFEPWCRPLYEYLPWAELSQVGPQLILEEKQPSEDLRIRFVPDRNRDGGWRGSHEEIPKLLTNFFNNASALLPVRTANEEGLGELRFKELLRASLGVFGDILNPDIALRLLNRVVAFRDAWFVMMATNGHAVTASTNPLILAIDKYRHKWSHVKPGPALPKTLTHDHTVPAPPSAPKGLAPLRERDVAQQIDDGLIGDAVRKAARYSFSQADIDKHGSASLIIHWMIIECLDNKDLLPKLEHKRYRKWLHTSWARCSRRHDITFKGDEWGFLEVTLSMLKAYREMIKTLPPFEPETLMLKNLIRLDKMFKEHDMRVEDDEEKWWEEEMDDPPARLVEEDEELDDPRFAEDDEDHTSIVIHDGFGGAIRVGEQDVEFQES